MAHMIMEAGKSKICRVGQRARNPGKSQCCSSGLKAVHYRIHSFSWDPSTDFMRPTNIRESNLLYSRFTYLSDNLIQIVFTWTPRMMFEHLSGHCVPDKLIYKINHHCGRTWVWSQVCWLQILNLATSDHPDGSVLNCKAEFERVVFSSP